MKTEFFDYKGFVIECHTWIDGVMRCHAYLKDIPTYGTQSVNDKLNALEKIKVKIDNHKTQKL